MQETKAAEYTCDVFCVHAASQYENIAVQDDLAYIRWVKATTTHLTFTNDEIVLMLRPAETAYTHTPLTKTYCEKQTSTSTQTFTPLGRTMISISVVLAAEREPRHELTLEALPDELTNKF